MNVFNLKVIRATQGVLPSTLVDQYGYKPEFLDQMISSLEKGYTEAQMADRFTFDEILKECGVEDQLAYLEEHATEDIPYFYIADVFHSWARIHEALYLLPHDRHPTDSGHLAMQNNEQFDSEVLCKEVWKKMMDNVLPFDVGVRVLCVLAVTNKKNAKRIAASSQQGAEVVRYYKAYMDKLRENNTPDGDTVSKADVTAAALFLLRALNDAVVSKPLLPFVGTKTGPYPLANRVDATVWCEDFGALDAAIRQQTADSAVLLVDVLNEKLKCTEKREVTAAI
ncbi:hypothetical protein STCU_09142 [Strigomonas culicis]|nr:hypothetical protein STCU_09142 [Strigomonas culicis]|eukprot:EPY20129.1 hypothetical protein STCU_09142 [Strigomonas culicis]